MINKHSFPKFLLITIVILSHSNLFSQLTNNNTKLEVVNFGTSGETFFCNDGYIDDDGNNIMLYSRNNSVGIALIDSNNSVQWAKEITTCPGVDIGHIIKLSNGNYFGFVGQNSNGKSNIFSFNQTSTILWHKEEAGISVSSISQCRELSNGNIAIIGQTGLDSYLLIIDPNGTQIWSKTISNGTQNQAFFDKVLATNDSNLLVFSRVASQSTSKSNLLLTKMDLGGSIIWEKYYEYDNDLNFYSNAIQTSNGNFFLAGSIKSGGAQSNSYFNAMVKKFDINGNYLDGKTYGYQYDDQANDIKEDQNDDLIIIGNSKPTYPCGGNLYVFKLNQNLDTIFTKHYGTAAATGAFYNTLNRKGNLFYTYGSGTLFSNINTVDAHFIKTTSDFDLGCNYFEQPTTAGNIPPHIEITSDVNYSSFSPTWTNLSSEVTTTFSSSQECFNGTLNVVGIHEFDIPELELFPNPTNNVAIIKSNSLNGQLVEITLFDISGKIFKNFTKSFTGKIIFDVSMYSPGAYIVQIKTTDFIVNKRLFIQ